MTLYMESVADQTDHFANAIVCENVAYGCDVMTTSFDVRKFKADAISFREIQCKKGIFKCFNSVFSASLAGIR